MPIIVGLPVYGPNRLAQDHPYTNRLIGEGRDLHILLGPEQLDRVGHVSASLVVSKWKAKGHWALYPKDFDTKEWAQNWMRLAGYINHDEVLFPGPEPSWVKPLNWPVIMGQPGMLWEFTIEEATAEDFKETLVKVVDTLWRYSYEVIQNTAEEYAFGVASTAFHDLTSLPTPQAALE